MVSISIYLLLLLFSLTVGAVSYVIGFVSGYNNLLNKFKQAGESVKEFINQLLEELKES